MTHSLVQLLCVPVGPSDVTISATDGKLLSVLGLVSLTPSCMDKSSIHLPCATTDLVVIDNLDSMSANVVLGGRMPWPVMRKSRSGVRQDQLMTISCLT